MLRARTRRLAPGFFVSGGTMTEPEATPEVEEAAEVEAEEAAPEAEADEAAAPAEEA